MTSLVEGRALAHVESRNLPQLAALMRDQHTKGRAQYGHPIDEWPATRRTVLTEAARELADLFTYLERAEFDGQAMSYLRVVAVALEAELLITP